MVQACMLLSHPTSTAMPSLLVLQVLFPEKAVQEIKRHTALHPSHNRVDQRNLKRLIFLFDPLPHQLDLYHSHQRPVLGTLPLDVRVPMASHTAMATDPTFNGYPLIFAFTKFKSSTSLQILQAYCGVLVREFIQGVFCVHM